jgi:hypothetical protein
VFLPHIDKHRDGREAKGMSIPWWDRVSMLILEKVQERLKGYSLISSIVSKIALINAG